ncbi:hypothetical protein [Ostreibacterium oceani]|uniref:Uncharacterized protein n=1 Tax=Ostreibacterium oceani TaxID=2654998 RepID=A0A6N7EWF4_9GAMM|nr:hypothetical protein [Ostreibacterium oceani]MPV85880.1 hypothetical protein [Ostreibacterium oceani]
MKKKLTSKIKKSVLLSSLFSGFALTLISYFIIKNAMSDTYPELIGLFFGGIIGSAGLFFLTTAIIFAEKIEINQDTIRIYSLTRKPLEINNTTDIESYLEINTDNGYFVTHELIILTKDAKEYLFTSYFHTNYAKLKRVLTKNKAPNDYAKKIWLYRKERRNALKFLIVSIIIFVFCLAMSITSKHSETTKNQLIEINGTVSNQIKIIRSGKRKTNRSIKIELKEYPNFTFQLGINDLSQIRIKQIINDIRKDKPIKIEILTVQYKKN